MNRINHREIPYFDRLPDKAIPALQAAYDKAKAGQFGTATIYRLFCNDLSSLGIEVPMQPIMTQWIERVRKGDVFRPGGEPKTRARDKQIIEKAEAMPQGHLGPTPEELVTVKPEEADSEPMGVVDHGAIDVPALAIPAEGSRHFSLQAVRSTPFFTPEFPAEDPLEEQAADDRVNERIHTLRRRARAQAEQTIDEVTHELERSARQTAQELVVGVLRDLLTELERGAA